MNPMMHTKVVPIVFAEAIADNTSPTTAEIDRLGFDYCSVYVRVGTTDIALTALKMQEADVSGGAYADIPGATFDGGVDIEGNTASLPSATADNSFRVFHIDLRGRKRYLELLFTVGDGSAGGWYSAFAILSRAKQGPVTNVGCAGTGGVVIAV